MNTVLKLDHSWDEVKEMIKEIEVTITDDDLVFTAGEEDALLKRLAAKLHRTPDEIKAWIESVSYNEGKAS